MESAIQRFRRRQRARRGLWMIFRQFAMPVCSGSSGRLGAVFGDGALKTSWFALFRWCWLSFRRKPKNP